MSLQNLPPRKPYENGFFFPFLIFAEVVLVLLFVLSYLTEQKSRESTLQDFRSRRPEILSSIQSALDRNDHSMVQRLDKKYSPHIADLEFRRRIADAVARMRAADARMEQMAVKLMDRARQQELQVAR